MACSTVVSLKQRREAGTDFLSVTTEACVYEAQLQPCSPEGTRLRAGIGEMAEAVSTATSVLSATQEKDTSTGHHQHSLWNDLEKSHNRVLGICQKPCWAAYEGTEELVQTKDAGVNKHRNCPTEGLLLFEVTQLTPLT